MTNLDGWLEDFREWLTAALSDTGFCMQGAGVEAGLSLYAVRGILKRGNTPLPKTVKALAVQFRAPSDRAQRWEQGARDALSTKAAKIKATREAKHPERYRRTQSVCPTCGKTLDLRRCHVGKKVYCSKACSYAAQRNRVRLTDGLRTYLWHEMTANQGITTYTGMANAWGMSFGGLARYFSTEGRLLKRNTLEKIAAYLDVNVEDLISRQGGITADDRIAKRAREWMLTLIQTVPRGPRSPETRARISAVHQGKPWSPERKAAYREAVWGDKEKAAARHKKIVEASKGINARLRRSLATSCQHLGREPTSEELKSLAARKVGDLGLPAGSQRYVLNVFKEKLGQPVPVGGHPALDVRYDFVERLREENPQLRWKEIARVVESSDGLPAYSIHDESLKRWYNRFSKRRAAHALVAS